MSDRPRSRLSLCTSGGLLVAAAVGLSMTALAAAPAAKGGSDVLGAARQHSPPTDGGVAGVCGDPAAGDCCGPTGTPACDDPVCCGVICAADPFCCDTEWDQLCADQALADPVNCPQCQPDPDGACCIASDCVIATESDCIAQGGNYQGDGAPCLDQTTFESFPNAALPDADPAGVSDTITVPDSITIADLDVALQVTHTWLGDLCVTLVHQPSGTTVDLIQRMGAVGATPCHSEGPFGCAEDNMSIVLDDEGTGGPIESQCAAGLSSPPNYSPINPLDAFDGLDAAGDWTLTVSDNAGADTGTFNSWALIFGAAGGGPCATSCPWDLNGDVAVGILDLLALLAAWGPNPGHPADFNGDGSVGILDLLALLANWGPCP